MNMKTIEECGGYVFPSEQGFTPDGTNNQTYDPGMSLRDWFAGMALQGMLASETGKTRPDEYATLAYMMSDAMLKESNK